MDTGLLPRNVTELAQETLADTPITVISGARQVGKSTLMQQLVRTGGARVVNLDDLGDRSAAEADLMASLRNTREDFSLSTRSSA